MARIDRAGQFSKRFSGASGATLLESDASCPLWIVHRAFDPCGELCVQTINVVGVDAAPRHWLTMAQTVAVAGAFGGEASFVIVLGIEDRLGGALVAASG